MRRQRIPEIEAQIKELPKIGDTLFMGACAVGLAANSHWDWLLGAFIGGFVVNVGSKVLARWYIYRRLPNV